MMSSQECDEAPGGSGVPVHRVWHEARPVPGTSFQVLSLHWQVLLSEVSFKRFVHRTCLRPTSLVLQEVCLYYILFQHCCSFLRRLVCVCVCCRYYVSNFAHDLLERIHYEPVFDINNINPQIYTTVPLLAQARVS